MKHSAALAFALTLILPGSAFAQRSDYPDWIKQSYCGGRDSEAACLADLLPDELFGRSDRLARDDIAEQWGAQVSLPRLAYCLYDHPQHPGWGFSDECYFTDHTRVSAVLRNWQRVRIRNGSTFTLEMVQEYDAPDSHTVNDLPARLVRRFGTDCYQVIASQELFCLMPVTDAGTTTSPDSDGWCMLREYVGPGVSVTQGRCAIISDDGGIGELSGEYSGTTTYQWDDGRTTRVDQVEDWRFLDDRSTIRGEDEGCIITETPDYPVVEFCFTDQPLYDPDAPLPQSAAGDFD